MSLVSHSVRFVQKQLARESPQSMCVRIDHTSGNDPVVIELIVQWLAAALPDRKSAFVQSLCRRGIAVKNEGLSVNASEPADADPPSIIFLWMRQH